MRMCVRLLCATGSRKGTGAWGHLGGYCGRRKNSEEAWAEIRALRQSGKGCQRFGFDLKREAEKLFCQVWLCMCQSKGIDCQVSAGAAGLKGSSWETAP